LITDKNKPAHGVQLEYEVIWVNDEMIFIDLIRPSIGQRTQHQIWISSDSLRIANLPHYQNYPDGVVDLVC
jgi:hypothetical protein